MGIKRKLEPRKLLIAGCGKVWRSNNFDDRYQDDKKPWHQPLRTIVSLASPTWSPRNHHFK
jgi:hypothetical protein